MAKTGRKVRTPEERAAFAEKRRAQVAALKERLAAWHDDQADEYIAAVTAMFDGYSERNAMLIAMQCPTATDVEGFTVWLERGRCVDARPPDVPPGEWGIKILAPAGAYPDADGDVQPAEQAGDGGADAKLRQRFKIAYVFDISQTHALDSDEQAPEPAAELALSPAAEPDGEAGQLDLFGAVA